jgi:trimeric autotransporter adhesin
LRGFVSLLAAWLVTSCGRVQFEDRRTGAACQTDTQCVVPTDACRSNVCTAWPSRDIATRTTLQLDRFVPAEALEDFPLLVRVPPDAVPRDLLTAGANLSFVDANGDGLAYELETIGDATAPLVAWVRIPSWDGTLPNIEMYVGAQPASTGSAWSNAFTAVWHMTDGHDATGNGHDAVDRATTAVAGQISQARNFAPAAQSVMKVADAPALHLTEQTISLWVKWHGVVTPDTYQVMIGRQEGAGVLDDFAISMFNEQLSSVALFIGAGDFGPPSSTLAVDRWVNIAFVVAPDQAAGTIKLKRFVDGVMDGEYSRDGSLVQSANPIYIGADRNGTDDGEFFNGSIDEVRIENVARSAAWIAASAANVRDEIISYGPLER